MKDQAYILREMVGRFRPFDFKAFAITSGKGGVGKTVFTVNLAYHLKKLGYKVLILDADFALANVDVMLNVKPKYNISHLIYGERDIEDIICDTPYGIQFIPATSGEGELANLPQEDQIKVFEGLSTIQDRYDILLIDTAAGLSNTVVNFCLAADKTIVLTTPEKSAIVDAYAVSKQLLIAKKDLDIGLIVNRVSREAEAKKIHNALNTILEKFVGKTVDYYGYIREDRELLKAMKEGYLISHQKPKSRFSKDVETIAKSLSQKKGESKENFFTRLIKAFKNNIEEV
ncbi:MAG: MinD/ParA family protein [Aquificae bacterium]|nr:MinD/ParA family protein [Aquificota bacterium]